MIAPIGEEFSPPIHPVRSPSRARAYATLYSPPPTHTSSTGANSIRPYPGGDRRIMHSPRLTRSYLQDLASRIFSIVSTSPIALVTASDQRTSGRPLPPPAAAGTPP